MCTEKPNLGERRVRPLFLSVSLSQFILNCSARITEFIVKSFNTMTLSSRCYKKCLLLFCWSIIFSVYRSSFLLVNRLFCWSVSFLLINLLSCRSIFFSVYQSSFLLVSFLFSYFFLIHIDMYKDYQIYNKYLNYKTSKKIIIK